MESELLLDNKNVITMKLLHYFITEKNYNPIILQGVENEIWLENLEEDCKVVRIVSGCIHNDEQFNFDVFKTKRILKKIKKKTFTFSVNVMSIFLDMGENVTKEINVDPKLMCINVHNEEDIVKSDIIKNKFPDLDSKMVYNENGMELFVKITNDINKHNKDDASRLEEVFKSKVPYITYFLIAFNIFLFILPMVIGQYEHIIRMFSIHGPSIRSGQYYRLLTGIFLHGSLMHLIFNCYALYVIGTQIENFLGKFKYIIIYLFSGIIGAFFSIIFGGNILSIGASGAIFGLMGALVYFGYFYRVYLGNVLKSQIIPLILLNLAIGFLGEGIDNAAHIGGLIGGLFITMALGVKDKSSKIEKVNGFIITVLFFSFVAYMGLVLAGK